MIQTMVIFFIKWVVTDLTDCQLFKSVLQIYEVNS